jgi:hypothetical protein
VCLADQSGEEEVRCCRSQMSSRRGRRGRLVKVDNDMPSGARYAYRKMHRMHARPTICCRRQRPCPCCSSKSGNDVCPASAASSLREQLLHHHATRDECRRRMCHSVAIARQRASPARSTAVLPVSYRFVCAHNRLQGAGTAVRLDKRPSHRLFPWPASLPGAMHVNSRQLPP